MPAFRNLNGSRAFLEMDSEPRVQGRFQTYLIRAGEAREIAYSIGNAEHRRTWEGIADDWEQLAMQIAVPPSSAMN